MINISEQSPGGPGTHYVSGVDVPVVLTITGSQLTQTGKITGINTGTITNGQPVDITTTFQNTGNIHYKVEGSVTVTNDQGVTLENIPVPIIATSIIPGISRDLEAIYTPSGSLPPGTYDINSQIMTSDGNVLNESTSSFTIKAPYTPPPALGTVNWHRRVLQHYKVPMVQFLFTSHSERLLFP
jgi:hypothetical protein